MKTKTTAPKNVDQQRTPNHKIDTNALQPHDIVMTPVISNPTRLFMSDRHSSTDILALQRIIGNTATLAMIQRAGGGGTGTAPAAADPIPEALKQLRAGTLIERNTAQMIDLGKVKYYYIDQCPPDPDSKLEATSPYLDILHPKTKEKLRIQKNAQGFRHDEYVFTARSVAVERVKSIFVHEVNHAMRGDHESDNNASSLARFKDEFQAYWVAEFAGVADLDDRARQIKAHILRDYPALQSRYASDADFKKQIDGHTRPDGNVLNSIRWELVEKATKGAGTNEALLFAALRAMNGEERKYVRGQPQFMSMIKGDLKGDDLLIAYLLLWEFSEFAVNCVEAMRGAGTNEEAIYKNLLDTTASERSRLKAYGSFMNRLRDDLNSSEMGVVTRILDK